MNVYRVAWGLSLIFGGCLIAGFGISGVSMALLTGIALIVAGIAFLAGI